MLLYPFLDFKKRYSVNLFPNIKARKGHIMITKNPGYCLIISCFTISLTS